MYNDAKQIHLMVTSTKRSFIKQLIRLTQNIVFYVIFIARFSELNCSAIKREAFNSENRGIDYLYYEAISHITYRSLIITQLSESIKTTVQV